MEARMTQHQIPAYAEYRAAEFNVRKEKGDRRNEVPHINLNINRGSTHRRPCHRARRERAAACAASLGL
jgi:hypothetical protein